MSFEPRSHILVLAGALLLPVLIQGCAQGSKEDLRRFVEEQKRVKAPPPESPRPFKVYKAYVFKPTDRDPFKPFFEEKPPEPEVADQDTGVRPPAGHRREELESYPLDSLRMVGTLERDGNIWAIILTRDETIHRVQVGNFMGQNYGKIINIQEDRVELTEIARDPQGRWQERPASIALAEQEQ